MDKNDLNKEAQKKEQQLFLQHSCSFDSKHNILVPTKINQYFIQSQFAVERVRCGGSHTIVFLQDKREDANYSCVMDTSNEESSIIGGYDKNERDVMINKGNVNDNNPYNNDNNNNNNNNKMSNNLNNNLHSNNNELMSMRSSNEMRSNLGGIKDEKKEEKSYDFPTNNLLGNKRSSPTKSNNK